jgi:protein-tyrosine-phosphatase
MQTKASIDRHTHTLVASAAFRLSDEANNPPQKKTLQFLRTAGEKLHINKPTKSFENPRKAADIIYAVFWHLA